MKPKTTKKGRSLSSGKRLWLFAAACLFGLSSVLAQGGFTASGIVTDPQGQPVVGVSVVVQGTTRGTVTDDKGKFSIRVDREGVLLDFNFIGYEPVSQPAVRAAEMRITMRETSSQIEEVVVIGYGSMRKVDVTGTLGSVSGAELAAVPVSSAAEALVGKVAGVRVMTQDGEPGADIDITVRGGMSITQDNSPLYIVDGFASETGLKGISPMDIESIDILKDASTTSIYGARGANGVVLVTTKSGKAGTMKVAYNGYVGFKSLPKSYDVMNSTDYVRLQYEMALRGETLDTFTENYGTYADIDKNYGSRGLDWQDIMFGGNALYHSHNFSVSGGSQKHKYMISYTHDSEDGILMNTSNRRNTFRVKFEQNLAKGLDLRTNVTFYQNKKQGEITSGNTLNKALQYRPVANIDASEDELIDAIEDPIGNSLQNPKASQLSQLRQRTNKNLTMDAVLSYRFLKDKMTLTVSGSGSWGDGRTDAFDDATSSAAGTKGGPFGSQKYDEKFQWQNTNTLSYADSFGKHHLNVMLGNELVFTQSRSLKAANNQFPDDNFGIYDLSLGSLPQKPESSFDETGLVSYFARAFYNFDDRYLLTMTLRTDGSSKFAKENRFGWFPSASAAWRISEEEFMKPLQRVISSLKLRASYGQSGNNRIGNNRYSSIFESNWYANGSSEIPSLISKTLGNPGLKWETTVSANIGLDFGLFNNRISGTVEVYKNKTKDLLLTADVTPTTAYTKQSLNIGSVQSHGVEVRVNTVNIRTKNFMWTSNFNISINKNKVKSLATGAADEYMLFKSGVGSYMEDYIVRVGSSTGLIYGYVNDGLYGVDDFDATLDPETGNYTYALKASVPFCAITGAADKVQPGSPRFKDVDGKNGITADDRTVIGNANPKHFGGFNNTFTYKGFDLSIFMNWSYGNDVLNYQKARLISTYQSNQNQSAALNGRFTYVDAGGNYVTEPGALRELNKNATVHAVKTSGPESNITVTQSDFVEDGSFLRINNVTLGYTFTGKWLKKAHISSLRLYATVNNLYTFTNYSGFDPDVNKRPNGGLTPGVDWSAYPKTRSVVFGVNLNF